MHERKIYQVSPPVVNLRVFPRENLQQVDSSSALWSDMHARRGVAQIGDSNNGNLSQGLWEFITTLVNLWAPFLHFFFHLVQKKHVVLIQITSLDFELHSKLLYLTLFLRTFLYDFQLFGYHI